MSAILGVSIATRNRWQDLDATLRAVEARPDLEGCPVVVVDDGSDAPADESLMARHPGVRFVWSPRSLGASEQRTRIAGLLDTEFVLQLDDDSFPVSGSVGDALAYLGRHPEIAALALNIMTGDAARPPISPDEEPYPVEFFVGCGVILRRSLFLELGGYASPLKYYMEELHFSAKALREGYPTYIYPSVVVWHRRTGAYRSTARTAYFKGRNRVLLVLWHYPRASVPFRLATSLPGTLRLVAPADYPAALAGFLSGMVEGLRMLRMRRPLSPDQFRSWRRLPSCYTPRHA